MKKESVIFLLVWSHVFLLSAVLGCDSRSVGVEGLARCGNGALDPGEECDDGNRSALDGCDDTCQVETAVDLVLLDHNPPYTLRSVRVERGGSLEPRDEYALAQVASRVPFLNRKFESVAACGRHVYVAVEGLGKIVHLTLDSQGRFTEREANRCVRAHSLVCDCEAGLVFATSRHSETSNAPMELHIYSMGGEGKLHKIGSKSIWPEGPDGPTGDDDPFWALVLQHSILIRPGTNHLWLTASFTAISSGSTCRSWRFSYDHRGSVSVKEASRSVFYQYVGGAASFSPDGTKYFMPRLNNTCLSWVDLGDQANLPRRGDVRTQCQGNGVETYSLGVDPEGHLYYYLEEGEVSIARLGSDSMEAVDRFASPVEGDGVLKPLFGGDILLVIGFDGGLATFALDERGVSPTLVGSMDLGDGSLRLGSTALVSTP